MYLLEFHILYIFESGLFAIKKATSQTLCQVGERSGTSPDDLTKWEVAMIAKLHPSLIKNGKRMYYGIQIMRKNKKDVN
jgi:hypothetical protein